MLTSFANSLKWEGSYIDYPVMYVKTYRFYGSGSCVYFVMRNAPGNNPIQYTNTFNP